MNPKIQDTLELKTIATLRCEVHNEHFKILQSRGAQHEKADVQVVFCLPSVYLSRFTVDWAYGCEGQLPF